MRERVMKWSSFVLSFFVVLSMLGVASAVTVPLVYVNPQATIANPGDVFTIDVNIQNVVNMYSWGMKLHYDQNVLEALSITEGPFLKSQPGGSTFVKNVFYGYIDVGASTLGVYPGKSGNGTLWHVTFEVKDLGAFALDLDDTQLLDFPTLTPIPHDVQDGSFETTWTADLARRSAWPSYHHFDISKAGPFQTLNGKVKNLAPMPLLVYVSFEIIRDDGFVSTVNTEPVSIAPGSVQDLPPASFGPLTSTDVGKYYVSAKAMYSFAGDAVSPGEKTKTFSFAAVP